MPQSQRFCFFRLKRDAVRERMLKEWNTSIMLRVRKAIVIPAGDSAIAQEPVSSRWPTK